MIYVTGDIHGNIDIRKLNTTFFPEQRQLTKNDYVIICGDFGNVWNNSKEELYWRKWLNDRNFTTLFCDGNHECFPLLNQFEIKEWNGGKVHFIEDSAIHLMRGQVFVIDGLKFFVMGGAESIDKDRRIEGKSWWPEELPSWQEYNESLNNLEKNNYNVDYVISHTTSTKVMETMGYIKENNSLNKFFDLIDNDNFKYKYWYFGHFHQDRKIDDRHTVVYNKIIKVE